MELLAGGEVRVLSAMRVCVCVLVLLGDGQMLVAHHRLPWAEDRAVAFGFPSVLSDEVSAGTSISSEEA